MNHFQLATHLYLLFQQQQLDAQLELIGALQKGWEWGAKVHELWKQSSSMLNGAGRKGRVVLTEDDRDHQVIVRLVLVGLGCIA